MPIKLVISGVSVEVDSIEVAVALIDRVRSQTITSRPYTVAPRAETKAQYTARIRAEKASRGECRSCRKPRVPGKAQCQDHLDYDAKKDERYRRGTS